LFSLPTSSRGKEFYEVLQRKLAPGDQLFQMSKSPDAGKMPRGKEAGHKRKMSITVRDAAPL
jgi:hypothetical protein